MNINIVIHVILYDDDVEKVENFSSIPTPQIVLKENNLLKV